MPKNLSVFDAKSTGDVLDVKSENSIILDAKSKNMIPINEETVYTDTRTISAGQPIGLLLSLTYPTDLSWQAART